MSPPPLKPEPAVILTAVWSMCSFATKFVVASWSICIELLTTLSTFNLALTPPVK
jgi:hypothetical protein